MLHLRRYFAALAVLSLLCGTYWLAAAPWIAPPKLAQRPAIAPVAPPVVSEDRKEELAGLFPEIAWERGASTKVLETEQCTLLIQDYLPTPEGELKLNPCTLIFYAKGAGGGKRRPIIMQAPAGAVLKFDKELDITRASFGRLTGGKLLGEIAIWSPPSQPGAHDALRLTTREVGLDRECIRTNYPVAFQYGESHGRGSGLEIEMLKAEADLEGKKKRAAFGGVRLLTLSRLEYVRVAMQGQGLLGEALPGKDQPTKPQSEPLEVKCQGPFTFDVPAQIARFVEKVEVLRLLPNAPPDKLRCDELLLTFLLKAQPGQTPPAAKPVDPLAGKVQRIVALGGPATLEAPTSGVTAAAAWMEFEMASRRITLRSTSPPEQPQPPPQPQAEQAQQVTLRQDEQHFTARELQYELAPAGRLGRMWAAGPGEIKLFQGRGQARQAITARWEKEMWVRPDDGNQVISLLSSASVIADPLGRFDADELHLWVQEVPVQTAAEPSPANQSPTNQPHNSQPPPAINAPRTVLVPLRLWAKRNVKLNSPQLDAETNDLQAWFRNVPPAAGPAAPQQGPQLPGPLREPIARAGFEQQVVPSGAIKNVIRPPSLQKFRVVGGRIQLQLAVQGRQFDLDDLIIEDRARIDEIRTPEPGQEPIHLAGDVLKVRHGNTPEGTIDVSGQPAEVAGRGLWLSAGNIHVHRGQNRLEIVGPGEATLPAPAEQSLALMPQPGAPPRPAPPKPPQAAGAPQPKLHLFWQEGLQFDGSVIQLRGEVQARTAAQTAAAPRLEATLSRRLDLLAPKSGEQPELAKIQLHDNVYLTNRSVNEQGEQVSFDQMQVPSLTIDRQAGTLYAPGPGWVSSVRRSSGLPGMPAAGGNAPPPIQPPMAPAAPLGRQPLTSVHVAYERELVGDLNRREIEFRRNVRTTYSPAQEFTDRIVVTNVAELGERAALMTSDTLTLTEMVTPLQRWIEMRATGHTILEGRTFNVNTPGRLTYSSATEYVTIEGDGRAAARIYQQPAPGEPFNTTELQRTRYNIRTGAFDGDINRLEFRIPAGGLKNLPGGKR